MLIVSPPSSWIKPHVPACYGEDLRLLGDLAAYLRTQNSYYVSGQVTDTIEEVCRLLESEVDFRREQATLAEVRRVYRRTSTRSSAGAWHRSSPPSSSPPPSSPPRLTLSFTPIPTPATCSSTTRPMTSSSSTRQMGRLITSMTFRHEGGVRFAAAARCGWTTSSRASSSPASPARRCRRPSASPITWPCSSAR
ncbi:MAG: hypothetical protein SFV54_03920 [Bryobacteraceae bacterium]|nr:hypothetical protein [Bryobacteraceae bacterium]